MTKHIQIFEFLVQIMHGKRKNKNSASRRDNTEFLAALNGRLKSPVANKKKINN
jgi:hypothetical protein